MGVVTCIQGIRNMKLPIFVCFVIIAISSTQGSPSRQKRDLTCAGAGQKGCSFSCKARGWKDGACTWITDTNREDVGQFKCECDKERRGIRCNLGGDNTCYYSCVALGYANGIAMNRTIALVEEAITDGETS